MNFSFIDKFSINVLICYGKNIFEKKVEQGLSEEELNNEEITPDRVGINVLKSRIRAEENRHFRRNLYIFISCMIVIVVAGVYVTYL